MTMQLVLSQSILGVTKPLVVRLIRLRGHHCLIRITPGYTHIVNGKVTEGQLIAHKCPTVMLIYTPLNDTLCRKAVVIIRNAHNHPMHPKTKATQGDRELLGKAVDAYGPSAVTAQKLKNGWQ